MNIASLTLLRASANCLPLYDLKKAFIPSAILEPRLAQVSLTPKNSTIALVTELTNVPNSVPIPSASIVAIPSAMFFAISLHSTFLIAVLRALRIPLAQVLNVFASLENLNVLKNLFIPVAILFPRFDQSKVSPNVSKNVSATIKA